MRTCPLHRPYEARALAGNLFRRRIGEGDTRIMSERQPRSASAARLPPSTGARALRRVRMMSADRWHAPLDARHMPTIIAVASAAPGVGQSVVACNLAASIAGLGRRVVLVDLDF